MKDKSLKHPTHINGSSGFVSYIVIAILLLIILFLLGVFFFAPETITKFSKSSSDSSSMQQNMQDVDQGGPAGQAGRSDGSIQLSDTDLADQSSTSGDLGQDGSTSTDGRNDGLAQNGSTAADAMGTGTSDLLASNIDSFFTTLDNRDYIKDFELDASSDVYFPKLIQNLVDNPPIVSGETDDLFTILQNTAHFFRILGKKNILVLKGILDRERDTFEQTLSDFYRLTDDPEALKEHFNITIGDDELYAYAGFFLNTMGGRLYLFRRDSMSRMVVSYYAIMIIEKANKEGRNKYGIEIKDAIDNLIIEIESSRIKLKMRDEYLDELYDLKVKYQ